MNENSRTIHARLAEPLALNSVVAGMVSYALARGISMDVITAETGLSRGDLVDPNARLPEDIIPKIWLMLSQAHPGKALSLEMATAAPLSMLGVLVQGLEFAPDVRTALQTLVRNSPIMSDRWQIAIVETAGEASLRSFHPLDSVDGGYAVELSFALGRRLLSEVLGLEEAILRVEFMHRPFGPIAVYREYFGVEVLFECPDNLLVLRRDAMDHRLPRSDAIHFKYVQTHLELVRSRIAGSSKPKALRKVLEAIAGNAQAADYSALALADRLNMSLRSLQRLAKRNGYELRALIEEARQANACQLLGDEKLSIEAIAHVLGYSDDRAFRRAFKRWSGQTPAEYRRAISP